MRIAFLINDINNQGGTEHVTTVIANSLSKEERIEFISILSIQNGNSTVYPLNGSIILNSLNMQNINTIFRRIIIPDKIERFVIDNHIDILICVDTGPYTYLTKIRKKKLCKIIVWEHFNYFNQPKGIRDKLKKKRIAKTADALVVLSKHDIKNYQSHIKKIKNIVCIYNPISVRHDLTSDIEKHRVIAVGRLVPQKGFDILIRIWKYVENSGEASDWKLDIYGSGPEKKKLENLIVDENVKNIMIHPFSNDIDNEYLHSSIFVLPSRFEGFALVLGEAQAFGLPIISFDIHEGSNEIVEDGKNGFLISPYDIKSMSQKLLILMNDKKMRKEFSRRSKENLSRFFLQNVKKKWLSLLDELYDEKD